MESTQILNVRLDEMLDAMCHDVGEVANVNRLCQECIIQKAIPRELYQRLGVMFLLRFNLPKLMGLKPPPSRGTFLDSVPVLELFMSGMAT